MMKSVADLKRNLTVGRVITVTNHIYPELSGERTVLKAQTNGWSLSFPKGHPKYNPTLDTGSWLNVPKASECEFKETKGTYGAVTITYADDGDFFGGKPFVTIEVAK